MKTKNILLGALCWVFLFPLATVFAEQPSDWDDLYSSVGQALVHAKSRDWSTAQADLERFQTLWQASSAQDKTVEQDLDAALNAVASKTDLVSPSLSALAKSFNTYVTSHTVKKTTVVSLEPLVQTLSSTVGSVDAGQILQAQAQFRQFLEQWSRVENAIHQANQGQYTLIETRASLARANLQAEPLTKAKTMTALLSLQQALQDSEVSASIPQSGDVPQLLALLKKAQTQLNDSQTDQAQATLETLMQVWPTAEGQVKVRSAQLYSQTETRIAQAYAALLSHPVNVVQAKELTKTLYNSLAPLAEVSHYTAWDAGLILLREGLEALLVLAALLAFLKKTNNQDKRRWVWSGAGVGLVLSGLLAIVLSLALSSIAAGGTRESLEGFVGLAAVVLMLTVGAWLHDKSNLKNWNSYVRDKMGKALAKGSLWSLAVVAGLAILREGAETIIFYLGIAPATDPWQMALGIGGALVLLAIIGFAIIKFSAKLPLRPFFLTAGILIYYLSFKILGESVHSLQVAVLVPSHGAAFLPTVGFLGVFPTWETCVPQAVLLVILIVQAALTEGHSAKTKQSA